MQKCWKFFRVFLRLEGTLLKPQTNQQLNRNQRAVLLSHFRKAKATLGKEGAAANSWIQTHEGMGRAATRGVGAKGAVPPKQKFRFPKLLSMPTQTPFSLAAVSRWWIFFLEINRELGEKYTKMTR